MSTRTITTGITHGFNSGDVIEVNGQRYIVNAVTSCVALSIGKVRWIWMPFARWFYMRGFNVDHVAYNFYRKEGAIA